MKKVAKKYTFITVPINTKVDHNKLIFRRVLLRVRKTKNKSGIVYFISPTLVDKDKYFDESHTHTYLLENAYYTLIHMEDKEAKDDEIYNKFIEGMINKHRKYHINTEALMQKIIVAKLAGFKIPAGQLFCFKGTVKEATRLFHNKKLVPDFIDFTTSLNIPTLGAK